MLNEVTVNQNDTVFLGKEDIVILKNYSEFCEESWAEFSQTPMWINAFSGSKEQNNPYLLKCSDCGFQHTDVGIFTFAQHLGDTCRQDGCFGKMVLK